jgi:hypothetical protein
LFKDLLEWSVVPFIADFVLFIISIFGLFWSSDITNKIKSKRDAVDGVKKRSGGPLGNLEFKAEFYVFLVWAGNPPWFFPPLVRNPGRKTSRGLLQVHPQFSLRDRRSLAQAHPAPPSILSPSQPDTMLAGLETIPFYYFSFGHKYNFRRVR